MTPEFLYPRVTREGRGCGSVEELLPSMYNALDLVPSTTGGEREERQRMKERQRVKDRGQVFLEMGRR